MKTIKLPCAKCGDRVVGTELMKMEGTRSHKKVCPSCHKAWLTSFNVWQTKKAKEDAVVEKENDYALVKGKEIFASLDRNMFPAG